MPDAYAYVVVVPAPVKGSTGFRRYGDNVQNLPDNRGQYMFWIKIGDTTDPKSRLGKYTNPDQLVGLAWLKNAPSSKPGKDLEALQLDGIGKTDTEWHALYAYDTDGAVKLCQALRHFVRRYPAGGVPVAQDFALFSDELGEVISQRYDNNQHDGREIEPQDIRAFAIYIIVTPSLDTANDGSSREKDESTKFWIRIKSANTQTSTSYALMVERFRTHMPSFSYNGFRVKSEDEMGKAVCMMQERLRDLLNVMKEQHASRYVEYKDGWVSVRVKLAERALVSQFVEWFDEGPKDLLSYNRELNETPLEHRPWKQRAITEDDDGMEEDI